MPFACAYTHARTLTHISSLTDCSFTIPRYVPEATLAARGESTRVPLQLLPAAVARSRGVPVDEGLVEGVGHINPHLTKPVLANLVIGNLFNGVGSMPGGDGKEARCVLCACATSCGSRSACVLW